MRFALWIVTKSKRTFECRTERPEDPDARNALKRAEPKIRHRTYERFVGRRLYITQKTSHLSRKKKHKRKKHHDAKNVGET